LIFFFKKLHFYLGVPPQEKCGVGLFVPIFFVFLHFAHAQGKKTKKDFHFNPSRKKTEVSIN
jgi:hypothetical protein